MLDGFKKSAGKKGERDGNDIAEKLLVGGKAYKRQ